MIATQRTPMTMAAKLADAERFCDRLIREGRLSVRQVKVLTLPALLKLDDSLRVHRFNDGGRKHLLTAYEIKKAELAKLPPGPVDPAYGTSKEVNKVEKFAEANADSLRTVGTDPKRLVDLARRRAKADPGFTAASIIGRGSAGAKYPAGTPPRRKGRF